MFSSTKPLHDRRRRLTTPALLVVVCGSVLVLGACTPRTTTAVPGSPDASGPAASSVPSTPAGPTNTPRFLRILPSTTSCAVQCWFVLSS